MVTLPAGQLVQEAAPATEVLPSAQDKQEAADVEPILGLNVPVEHVRQAETPEAADHLPASHATHSPLALVKYWPGLQASEHTESNAVCIVCVLCVCSCV